MNNNSKLLKIFNLAASSAYKPKMIGVDMVDGMGHKNENHFTIAEAREIIKQLTRLCDSRSQKELLLFHYSNSNQISTKQKYKTLCKKIGKHCTLDILRYIRMRDPEIFKTIYKTMNDRSEVAVYQLIDRYRLKYKNEYERLIYNNPDIDLYLTELYKLPNSEDYEITTIEPTEEDRKNRRPIITIIKSPK